MHKYGIVSSSKGVPIFPKCEFSCSDWKVVVESRKYTGILGPRRRRIQSGARDEAWSLRAFV